MQAVRGTPNCWACYLMKRFIQFLGLYPGPYLGLYLGLCALLVGCSAVPSEPAPLALSLTASTTQGEAPLEVRFTARATPEANRYTWTVSGRSLSEASGELVHTFGAPGLYIVGARAERGARTASETLTVQVSAPRPEPTPPTPPGELSVTRTPGGPAPWAVRYDVLPVLADPAQAVRGRCSAASPYRPVTRGVLTCVHEAGDEASFELPGVDEVQRLSVASGVTSPAGGVAFSGRWRYRSRGVTEDFSIVRGSETSGWSEDGRFRLFTIRQGGAVIVEFTLDGRTVVLEPLPEADGRQVFFADVYGLELERLD